VTHKQGKEETRDGAENRSKRVYALVREPLPRVRELAQLVADHVLRDGNGRVGLSVMHHETEPM
jgi:prophage maintenance system killer protein